jgi:hypothetical protein
MQFDYDLYGSVPVIKKYQYGVTIATISASRSLIPAANTAPASCIGTTTGATDLVGMSIDKGSVATSGVAGRQQSTYTTTQGTGIERRARGQPDHQPLRGLVRQDERRRDEDTALARRP